MANKQKLIILIAVVIVLAIAVFWYISLRNTPIRHLRLLRPLPPAQAPTEPVAAPPSLGTKIYEQSQNPIQNKVPTTNNPAVNPIEGAYKNPF